MDTSHGSSPRPNLPIYQPVQTNLNKYPNSIDSKPNYGIHPRKLLYNPFYPPTMNKLSGNTRNKNEPSFFKHDPNFFYAKSGLQRPLDPRNKSNL